MKCFTILALTFFLVSCDNQSPFETDSFIKLAVNNNELTTHKVKEDSTVKIVEDEFLAFQTYYIVCLDSSKNYRFLDKSMYFNAKTYDVTIDTAERSYNTKKDLIALADDAEDEIYAGEYYPRRFPSKHLSLEYLYIYDENINTQTIGLIAAICNERNKADSILTIFKPINPNSFVLKGKVYVGCMH